MAQTITDEDLRTRVMEELAWDALIDDSTLEAEVDGGVVTLIGRVSSHAERVAALEAARQVEGVHDLLNAVEVVLPGESQPTDEELDAIVHNVLEWNAFVPHEVSASVASGWVTLSGSTPSDAQRIEAERAVSNLSGVRGVTNSIIVRSADVTPDDAREAIAGALARRAVHRAAHIDVSVDGHVVTLRGPIQTPLERAAVLSAVRHAPGIDMVCDDLYLDASGATE